MLLLSVSYALKAADAETLGGKPASAFMTASGSGAGPGQTGPQAEQKNEIVCSSGTACKTGFVPLFSSNGGSAKATDSIVTQSGTAVNIAGSETTTGDISSSGSLSASGSMSANGTVSASNMSATSSGAPAVRGENHGTGGGSDGVDGIVHGPASGVAGINDSTSGVGPVAGLELLQRRQYLAGSRQRWMGQGHDVRQRSKPALPNPKMLQLHAHRSSCYNAAVRVYLGRTISWTLLYRHGLRGG